MQTFMTWLETATGRWLFHTTSLGAMQSILAEKRLVGKPFISFSEIPWYSDISGKDCTLVFHASAMMPHLMKVEYNEDWFDRFPDQANYIAGEGWHDQFTMPDYL